MFRLSLIRTVGIKTVRCEQTKTSVSTADRVPVFTVVDRLKTPAVVVQGQEGGGRTTATPEWDNKLESELYEGLAVFSFIDCLYVHYTIISFFPAVRLGKGILNTTQTPAPIQTGKGNGLGQSTAATGEKRKPLGGRGGGCREDGR